MPTFARACETVIAIHAENWREGGRNEEHWRATLTRYVLPRIGDRPVNAVTTADVMAVLLPIWSAKRTTAKRVRQRIGAVMKWAIAQGYRAAPQGHSKVTRHRLRLLSRSSQPLHNAHPDLIWSFHWTPRRWNQL